MDSKMDVEILSKQDKYEFFSHVSFLQEWPAVRR